MLRILFCLREDILATSHDANLLTYELARHSGALNALYQLSIQRTGLLWRFILRNGRTLTWLSLLRRGFVICRTCPPVRSGIASCFESRHLRSFSLLFFPYHCQRHRGLDWYAALLYYVCALLCARFAVCSCFVLMQTNRHPFFFACLQIESNTVLRWRRFESVAITLGSWRLQDRLIGIFYVRPLLFLSSPLTLCALSLS